MRGNHNHLFVPVSINRQNKSWWLIDTGAPISTITESAAKKASLQGPEIASKIPTSVKVEGQDHQIVIAHKMVSEGFDFGEQPLVVLRLDGLGRERMQRLPESFKNGGILGLPILKKYGALINCRTRQIFLNSGGSHFPYTARLRADGVYLCAYEHYLGYHIEAIGTIGTGEYSFLIDTGAPDTLIMASIRRKEKVPFITKGQGWWEFTILKIHASPPASFPFSALEIAI